MTTHANMIEDTTGDVVDIEYFCSDWCYTRHTGQPASGYAWPCGSETDYDVHCANAECGTLLWRGLQSEEHVTP